MGKIDLGTQLDSRWRWLLERQRGLQEELKEMGADRLAGAATELPLYSHPQMVHLADQLADVFAAVLAGADDTVPVVAFLGDLLRAVQAFEEASRPLAGPLSANQKVAFNLRRARVLHGWTQDRAADRLAPQLGVRWSRKSFSNIERSASGGPKKNFSANEIAAFAVVCDLPVQWWFETPEQPLDELTPPRPTASFADADTWVLVDAETWDALQDVVDHAAAVVRHAPRTSKKA